MKTLAELQSVLSAFPRPFAAQGDLLSDFPLVDEGGEQTNFETGIPSKYSPSETTASLMPRGDFNRIGEIASRELFFRSAGGIHTFDKDFSAANNGYADRIALAYDDGRMIRTVESQEAENDLDFTATPAVIDSLANKPSDASGTPPRVLWKTASRLYGVANGILHVGVDYSRQQVVSSGETLDHDSFVVIGASYYGWTNPVVTQSGLKTAGTFRMNLSLTLPGESEPIDMSWDNKGMQGQVAGGNGLINSMLGPIYPAKLYGGANAPFAFFARKGTKVKYDVEANGRQEGQTGIYAYAYPLEAEAAAEEDE